MISRIARKECLELLRDGRVRVLAVVLLILSAAAFAAGWRQFTDVTRQHEAARQATRDQWVGQPEKNPHSAAHYGVYAFKPTSQLAMIDSGIDPFVGVASWLEAHKQNEFKYRPAQDRTATQRFGEMTGASVLQLLVPLFIVLMTFSAFAGEREQGTLRQVLAQGVSPRLLAMGKFLGIGAALGLVLVPITLLGTAAIILSASGGAFAADPARGVVLAAMYLGYFALVVALSLTVSMYARTARVVLVVLLAGWFANGFVAPRVVSDFAAWRFPTPSALEFQTALEKDLSDTAVVQARLEQKKADLFKTYGVDRIEALPVGFSGISLQESEEHGNEVFDRHYGRLFAQYGAQNTAQELGGIVAPLLAVRSISMALSGTDFAHHRDFVDAAERYRRDMQRILNGDIVSNQRAGQVYLASRALWDRVPPFDYLAPSTGWALGRAGSSLAILLAWIVAAVAWMVHASGRALAE